jgi:hypothetical protein
MSAPAGGRQTSAASRPTARRKSPAARKARRGGKAAAPASGLSLRGVLRDNGLTIALTAAFAATLVAMALFGWRSHNQDLAEHGVPAIGLARYLGTGEFLSAVLENWESEFLQMSVYVVLTAMLFQRGSAESRDPDGAGGEPRPRPKSASLAVRIGAWLYAYSLGIVLAILFLLSFVGHLVASAEAANAEAALHGGEPTGLWAHLGEPRFWFESMQNWQSEFLSTAVLVVLSIFLRFHGSPESKKVEDPHLKTGA